MNTIPAGLSEPKQDLEKPSRTRGLFFPVRSAPKEQKCPTKMSDKEVRMLNAFKPIWATITRLYGDSSLALKSKSTIRQTLRQSTGSICLIVCLICASATSLAESKDSGRIRIMSPEANTLHQRYRQNVFRRAGVVLPRSFDSQANSEGNTAYTQSVSRVKQSLGEKIWNLPSLEELGPIVKKEHLTETLTEDNFLTQTDTFTLIVSPQKLIEDLIAQNEIKIEGVGVEIFSKIFFKKTIKIIRKNKFYHQVSSIENPFDYLRSVEPQAKNIRIKHEDQFVSENGLKVSIPIYHFFGASLEGRHNYQAYRRLNYESGSIQLNQEKWQFALLQADLGIDLFKLIRLSLFGIQTQVDSRKTQTHFFSFDSHKNDFKNCLSQMKCPIPKSKQKRHQAWKKSEVLNEIQKTGVLHGLNMEKNWGKTLTQKSVQTRTKSAQVVSYQQNSEKYYLNFGMSLLSRDIAKIFPIRAHQTSTLLKGRLISSLENSPTSFDQPFLASHKLNISFQFKQFAKNTRKKRRRIKLKRKLQRYFKDCDYNWETHFGDRRGPHKVALEILFELHNLYTFAETSKETLATKLPYYCNDKNKHKLKKSKKCVRELTEAHTGLADELELGSVSQDKLKKMADWIQKTTRDLAISQWLWGDLQININGNPVQVVCQGFPSDLP